MNTTMPALDLKVRIRKKKESSRSSEHTQSRYARQNRLIYLVYICSSLSFHVVCKRHESYHQGEVDAGEGLFERRLAHTSSVATAIRSFTLPKLSRAGRTSSEKTGEPSGSGGAE